MKRKLSTEPDQNRGGSSIMSATGDNKEGKGKVVYNQQSDDDFQSWILQELETENPELQKKFPDVFVKISTCILKWRKRYHGNAPLWNRIFKRDRVIKEAIESVPIIHAVDKWMTTHEKVTIIDLCSGKGMDRI
jgi:hypothetical protein